MNVKLTLNWGLTPRESPDDENPICPKFESYDNSCGCATIPFQVEGIVHEKPDEICMSFYHHKHCKYIKSIAHQKWVADSQELEIKSKLDDMTFEEYEKLVKEFAKKQRERAQLEKGNKMQKADDNKQPDKDAGKTTPLCQECKVRPKQVTFYPCLHDDSCIACAQRNALCPTCSLPYSGLSRHYCSPSEFMTVPVVDLSSLD